MRLAEQERQEEMLTSLKPTRRVKHATKNASTSPTAKTTKIPA